MKLLMTLILGAAALAFTGCRTNHGGTGDQYESSSGSVFNVGDANDIAPPRRAFPTPMPPPPPQYEHP